MNRFMKFFCSVLVMLAASRAQAQVVMPTAEQDAGLRRSVFGLGIFGGAAGGLGLSFRHHLPSHFSYQLTGGIIKVDDRLQYDIGAELHYDLVRNNTMRVYVGGATAYFHSGRSGENNLLAPGRFGLGLGGEMNAAAGFHGSLELMFTYFTDGTVLPLPQLGFYYYFY